MAALSESHLQSTFPLISAIPFLPSQLLFVLCLLACLDRDAASCDSMNDLSLAAKRMTKKNAENTCHCFAMAMPTLFSAVCLCSSLQRCCTQVSSQRIFLVWLMQTSGNEGGVNTVGARKIPTKRCSCAKVKACHICVWTLKRKAICDRLVYCKRTWATVTLEIETTSKQIANLFNNYDGW